MHIFNIRCVSFTESVFLDMGMQFKSTSNSGHLSSPEFPNIHHGKIDTTCMLTAINGVVEVEIAHIMLEQGQDCKEYLEVISETDDSKVCQASREVFRGESLIISFIAENNNGRSAVWLVYKGLYQIFNVATN